MEELKVYELSKLAGCGDPDSPGSPGWTWLDGVRDRVAETVTNGEVDEDTPAVLADDLVPIYTHHLWEVFVDLAGYQEDITELGTIDGDNLEDVAKRALYLIAERLVSALLAEVEA